MNPQNRPTLINRAAIFIIVSLVLGFIKIGLDYAHLASMAPIQASIPTMLITVLILLFINYKVWTGRNWARITFTVFFIVGMLPSSFMLIAEFHRNGLVFLVSLLQILLQVIGIIYLFLPTSNTWFKDQKNLRKNLNNPE